MGLLLLNIGYVKKIIDKIQNMQVDAGKCQKITISQISRILFQTQSLWKGC